MWTHASLGFRITSDGQSPLTNAKKGSLIWFSYLINEQVRGQDCLSAMARFQLVHHTHITTGVTDFWVIICFHV